MVSKNETKKPALNARDRYILYVEATTISGNATYPTTTIIVVNNFECHQAHHLAKEHKAGLHKGMLELSRLSVGAGSGHIISPSRKAKREEKMFSKL